jgi:GTP-binding protein Era
MRSEHQASGSEGEVPPTDAGSHRAGYVALVGLPNVGKSTLLNAYVGEKVAITSPRPQTTRRRILGIRTTPVAQVVFVDTPGIHRPKSPLGRYMVGVARSAIPDADVIVWVVDVSRPPSLGERTIGGWIADAGRPAILALNKSDKLAPDRVIAQTEAYEALAPAAPSMPTIATDAFNLERLWSLIVERLPVGPAFFPDDEITDQTERALGAEFVREAALRFLEAEVPHGIEVLIEEWTVRPGGVTYDEATLIVEREGHKAIVLGKGGAMIRRIGSAARREIEAMVGAKVFLDLHVVVRADWRRDKGEVRSLGYR